MNRLYIIIVLCFLVVAHKTQAQGRSKSEKFLDVSISPSLGFRVLGGFKVPASYKGTQFTYKDSLNKADRPAQTLNFGLQYTVKKTAFSALSIGLSYTTLSFRRVAQDMKIGYVVHPQVGIIAGVIQAGYLQVNYDFKYHYLEVPVLWNKSAEGYGNYRDFDFWYTLGVAPAVLLRNRTDIHLVGFTLNGKSTYSVKDSSITGVPVNMIAHVGFRAQYHMYKNLYGLIQPRARIPLLPSSAGTQTMWCPQLSLDLGLVFVLSRDKAHN